MPGMDNLIKPAFDTENSQLLSSSYDIRDLTSGKKRMFVSKVGESELDFVEVGKFPIDATRIFETSKGMVVASSDGSFHRLDQSKLIEAVAKVKNMAKSKSSMNADKKEDPTKPADGEPDAMTSKSDDENATSKEKSSAEDTKTRKDRVNELVTENDSSPRRGRRPRFGLGNDDEQEDLGIEVFKRVGPDSPVAIRTANHVDYCHERDEFAVYRRGTIRIYKPNGEEFEQYASLKLDLSFDEGMTSRIAYQGGLIVIAFGNGKVITVDAESLEEKNEYQPENRTGIWNVWGSRSGRYFGIHYRNGNLWLLDTETESELKKAEIVGQGAVASFAFDNDDHMWVCDNSDRASEYDLVSGEMNVRHSPPGGWVERVYRYGLKPFYTICPKPGEFYKVVSHLSSAGDSEENADVDMNKTFESSDPWGPLWSGLLFMFIMLFMGCLIFRSKDY